MRRASLRRPVFPALRRILVPVIHGCDSAPALLAARAIAPEVILVGFVPIRGDEALSAGAARAREVRQTLRRLAEGGAGRSRARVRVTSTPWSEIREALDDEQPDLLMLEWPFQVEALGAGLETFLAQSSCDSALDRKSVV